LIIDGTEAAKAAIDTQILIELAGYQLDVVRSWDLVSYAAAIAEDIYLTDMAGLATKVLCSIKDREIDAVKDTALEMGATAAVGQVDIPTSTDAGLEFISSIDEPPSTVITGIGDFDRKFGGFSRRSLTLIAARPQMGKTAIALQIAKVNAEAGRRVLYFSIEMSKQALWSRLALGAAGVDSRKFKSRSINPDERQRLIDKTGELIDALGDRLLIDDRSKVTTADIWRAVSQVRPDCVIVDHLSLVADEGDNEVLRLGKISWMGKALAKEFDCAAIYLQQLNRGVEARDNKRPILSDLRGSGELEQNADVVIFIHREDYYQQRVVEVSSVELGIAKDRDGTRNQFVPCVYHLGKQVFYSEARA
jgi:replicative DNA helicase